MLSRVQCDVTLEAGERIWRELDTIPIPVEELKTVAAVLLPALVSAEAGLRAGGEVERSFNVLEVNRV